MSYLDDYLKAKKKLTGSDKIELAPSETDSFYNEYLEAKKQIEVQSSITPTVGSLNLPKSTKAKQEEKDEKDLFGLDFVSSGTLSDGYDRWDVVKGVGYTVGDLLTNAVHGFANGVEGVTDLLFHGGAYAAKGLGAISDKLGADKMTESYRNLEKTLRESANIAVYDTMFDPLHKALDKGSFFGETIDNVGKGIGQVGLTLATGGAGQAAGLSGNAVSLLTSGTMFASGAGSGISEAYANGATDGEAALYGTIAGAADAATELLFGGLGKSVNALGFNKGLLSADDLLAKKVTSKISSQIARNFAEFGIKAGAEGVEEVLAGFLQGVGKKLTYMSEEELGKILADENLLEQFVVGALTSGVMQSGDLAKANKTKTDFITGYDQNEQAVIKKETENRIAEQEKDGTKLTGKQKSAIEAQVESDMKRGYISTSTIEEVLGSDASEMVKDRWLGESYREIDRTKEDFKPDYNKYKGAKHEDAVRKTIESAVKAGANNTNRVHDLVDLAAKLAGDTGKAVAFKSGEQITADFIERQTAEIEKIEQIPVAERTVTQNELLAELKDTLAKVQSGEVTVNGDITADGITLNLDSPKPLNRVVGHEITHSLGETEQTAEYVALKEALFSYAKAKNVDIDSKLNALKAKYAGITNANPEAELVADLVGDYLFTDKDFIMNLSTSNRNLFQRLFDEIKYLYKLATAGSQEARELEKVKKAFEEAYRASANAQKNTTDDGGVKYAIQSNVVDADGNVYKKVIKPGLTIYNKVKHSSHAYVAYIQNKIFPRTFSVQSYDGESITVEFAKDNERFKKDGDKTPRRALGELEAADNSLKKIAVLNIKDLIKTSEPLAPKAENSHQWLDAGGWQERITYMRMDDTVYPVILHISKARDGRYLLYDVSVLKNKGSTVDTNATALASLGDVGASSSQKDGSKLAVKSIEPSGEILAQEEPVVKSEYSLSTDSDGKELSKGQQEYFKDSKVVDESGNLLKVYHGTTNKFTVFRQGTADGWGTGIYFTNNRAEASEYGDNVVEAYLNITNPYNADTMNYYDIGAENTKAYRDYDMQVWKNQFEEYDTYEEYKADGRGVDMADIYAEEVEVFNKILRELGYDGIIADSSNGIDGLEIVAFNENQPKLTTNTNPSGNPDVRYSLSEDSTGRSVSTELQDRLQFSRVRDESGRLKPMFHGTPNGDIANFKAGTYFTENREYADRYQNPSASSISAGKTASNPKTFEAYLDIRKPFDLSDPEAKRIYIEDYIKGGNAIGINPYLSDAEYAKIESIDWTEGEDLKDFLIENGYDYDGLVLDEGADGGYGEEVKYRGKSYVIFSSEQAVRIDTPEVRYSLSEDNWSKIREMQTEVNRLNESIREIEASEEYKEQMRKITEAVDSGNVDAGVKGYQRWLEDSGFGALTEKRNALRDELESLRKKAEETQANEAVEAERKAIEKSGLSEADYFRKQAVKEFGYTPYFYDAGYITTNGKMLNFSGEKGQHFGSRGQDHRAIGIIYAETDGTDALNRFVNEGNIRISPESPGVDLSATVEPTKEQYATIKKFAYHYADKGYFSVDISDKDGRVIGSLEYENRIYPTKIISDIQHYFATGEIRQPSELDKFRYSLSDVGEQIAPAGNFDVYGKDVKKVVPAEDNIPIREDVATEEAAPVQAVETATVQDLFPDDLASIESELSRLVEERSVLEERLLKMVESGDMGEEFNQLSAQWDAVNKRANALEVELEADEADRVASYDDADAPPIAEQYDDSATDVIPITKKLENDIAREVRAKLGLGNKHMADVRSIINEYSQSEFPSREQLFEELKDKFGTYTESYTDESLVEAKKYLRTQGLHVGDYIKKDIADYESVRKQNRYKIKFSDTGTPVDMLYEELSGMYPHLFPESIYVPTDQLMRMIEVANMDKVSEYDIRLDDEAIYEVADTIINSVSEYRGVQKEKAANKYGRESFNSLMQDADQYVPPVNLDQVVRNRKPAEASVPAPETVDATPRNGVPEGQQAMWAEPVSEKVTRKELHQGIVDDAKEHFAVRGLDFDEVLKEAKDLSTFATVDNTPQRVMEKALGYKAGQALADITVNRVAQNETEGIKWLNSITDRKNGLLAQISKRYNIKPGSKESAAAQMYAEGFYVGKNNDIIAYGDKELAVDFPDAKVRANIKDLARDPRIREFYDTTLAMINESRKRNAYPEIPRLDNYFLHFRAMDDTFSKLGLPFNPNDIRAKDLPTDLNGVTADLKPGQPYFASAKHREGKRTSFDLLGGLERYATSAKNQIYHIDDIQTLRALRNYIADTYGQANGLEGLDTLSEEEAQDRIEQVYNSHLSTFAKFLNEEANVLAGKTSLIDRGLEGVIGRRGITFLNTVNQQVGKNMVGFNISSSLTNFLPVAQTFAKTNKFDFLKAFAQTASNKIGSIFGKNDGFAESSPVMIRRKGADSFYRTPWQKLGDAGYVFMSAVDDISTELIARTKYNELIRQGMDSQQAHIETDKWVSRLMGDRSLGQQPQLYNSKMLGLFTKFQLEVRNQLDSQFYDTIQEANVSTEHIQNNLERNAKKAAKITSTFVQLAVVQHLFGKAFESIAGYNPAFDIIDALIKAFGWDDEEEDEDTVLDNIEEGFLALLGDLPYTSTFTGGRIPISSALPVEQFVTGKDDYGNEVSRWDTLKGAAPYYLLPGGYGQIKKTKQGLEMFDDELPIAGSYTDSGNLRFPVEDTIANRLQAGLFGQYASENARDYFNNDRTPLKEKQIQEFIDSELPIADYHKYRDGLKDLNKQSEKLSYINGLNVTEEQKDVLKSYLFDEEGYAEDNPEKYAFLEREGIGYLGYKQLDEETQESWSWAFNNQEEYEHYKANGIMPEDYSVYRVPMLDFDDEADSAYEWSYNYPEKATMGKVFSNVKEYRQYTTDLSAIRADKDANGKSISGSAKEKKRNYIWSLNIDEGAKYILFKSEYPSDDTYNYQIVEYLDNRADISYEEMVTILTELGYKVSSTGYVTWD